MSVLDLSTDFREVTALAHRLGVDARPELERELVSSMTRIVLAGQRQAVSTARHDTGDNRRRHTHAVERVPDGVIGTIGTSSPHGPAVEEGRKPGRMPPPGVLLGWMARRGIAPAGEFEGRRDLSRAARTRRPGGGYFPVEYLIARAIARHGTKGDHNLRETVRKLAPTAERELAAVGPRVIQRLVKGTR